ncbi:butyrophilin subfamily 1 member A1-like [Alosa alosa]|nr:butyrophilin subfamily 1 member A1-like [Alosa alosa]
MTAMAHFLPTSLAAFFVIVLVHFCRECHAAVELRLAGQHLEVVDSQDVEDNSVNFRLVGSEQPVEVLVGHDVVLPCSVHPRVSAVDFNVDWMTHTYNEPTNKVHTYRNGRDENQNQIEAYRHRTALFRDELRNGNLSLKLSAARVMDTRSYFCITQSGSRHRYAVIPLTVRAKGSKPNITIEACEGDSCKLVCESIGWSPKPAVDWLDEKRIRLTTDAATSKWDPVGGTSVRRSIVVETNAAYICRVSYKDHVEQAEIHI